MTKLQKKNVFIVSAIVLLPLLAIGAFAAFSFEPPTPPSESSSAAVLPPADSPDIEAPDIEEGDIVSDLAPLTGVPLSGEWSFKLDISNPGTADIAVAPNGQFLIMNVAGQTLFFYTTSTIVPYTYKTNNRSFELQNPDGSTGTGYAHYEFTAVDDDVIDGTLYHDTDILGIVERSFHMELLTPELPDMSWFALLSGTWNLDYHDAETDCEDNEIASFDGLPTEISLDNTVDLDTGEPTGEINLDLGNSNVSLEPGDDPNAYSQATDPVDAGFPVNSAGDLLLDFEDDTFTAEYNAFGFTEDDIEGYVNVTGSNGCSYTVGFTATHAE